MPDGAVIDPTGERISFESAMFLTLRDDGAAGMERSDFAATTITVVLELVRCRRLPEC
jgi:hypothetical protein